MAKETKQNAQRGFTVLELAIVLVVSSLLLVPLLKLAFQSVGGNREQQTEAAFEKAVDALIAYAVSVDPDTLLPRNGCLPFAADFEGGLPDTDLAGLPLTDTGAGKANQHAGDLPWADLGLLLDTRGGFFLDGDFLRIQYYVAKPYAGAVCRAGFRGQEWNPQVTYLGAPDPDQIYVYDTADQETTNLASLYVITGTLAAGNHPSSVEVDIAEEVTALLTDPLLAVKRGPDITSATNGQSDIQSTQNVFVLLAVGENRNAALDRRHMRDSTHAGDDLGGAWALGESDVDGVVFSMTHNVSATDRLDDGDDTIRVVSFLEYKSRLTALGMILQPLCETSC